MEQEISNKYNKPVVQVRSIDDIPKIVDSPKNYIALITRIIKLKDVPMEGFKNRIRIFDSYDG